MLCINNTGERKAVFYYGKDNKKTGKRDIGRLAF
jgi:hypothetical protein